jgi:hypothetical protein
MQTLEATTTNTFTVELTCSNEPMRYTVNRHPSYTEGSVRQIIAHIEGSICNLWHYGSHREHRITNANKEFAEIIGKISIITLLTGDRAWEKGVVWYLRDAAYKAHDEALARLRK